MNISLYTAILTKISEKSALTPFKWKNLFDLCLHSSHVQRLLKSRRALFQVEFQRLLPLVHDDFPHFVRRVDRTAVGLHAGERERRELQPPEELAEANLGGAPMLCCRVPSRVF
jgi:hypothetical protein